MKHHIMAARRRLWVFQARTQGNRHAPDARTATAASNADGGERLAADEHSQRGMKDTTQADGQQALTAQPAMPAAQQTAQTADADQASTSQALATTAQHAQPARTSPRGSHGLGSAQSDPRCGPIGRAGVSFHSQPSRKLFPNPQFTNKPINRSNK